MKLYHGGAIPVPAPLPESPFGNRPLDFGSGFYTTTDVCALGSISFSYGEGAEVSALRRNGGVAYA